MKISRTWKWIAGIGIGILLLLGGAVLYLSQHLKPMLSEKLKKAVYEGSDGLYRIDYNDLYFNLATGYISLDHPRLIPDTVVYEKLRAAGAAPKNLWTIHLDKLVITGAKTWKAWREKEIEANEILIEKPAVRRLLNKAADTSKHVDNRTLYQRIKKSLRSIHVEKIVVSDADLETYSAAGKGAPFRISGLMVRVTDVLIDSASQFDSTRFYTAKDVFFQLKNYVYRTADGMYRLKLGEVTASTSGQYVHLKDFKVIPQYSNRVFSHKYTVQHDRYDMTFPDIVLDRVNFNRYDAENRLIASALIIDRAQIGVFLDRSLPPPPIDKWVNFPHVIIRRLQIPTLIDTLRIRRSRMAYTEFNPASGQSGTIWFSSFNASVAHVTNDSLSLKKDHHSRARLSGRLYGKTALYLSIDFDLTDRAGAFTYSGSTANLDLTGLNVLNRPLSLVEVKSGIVQKATFSVSANRYGSKGTLRLYYSNLKVGLLKKTDDGKLKKKGALSLIANVLLVKNDNPKPGEPLRVANVSFSRPHSSSFFNLIWKGVFVNIKESVGLGMIKEKKTQSAEKKK